MDDPIQELADLQQGKPKSGSVSEDAAAAVFRERYGDGLQYCVEKEEWLIWDDHIWRSDKTDAVFNMARQVARDAGNGKTRTGSASFARGIIAFAKADPAFARTLNQFDADPFLLGTPRGPVDLKLGKLISPTPDEMVTMSTSVAPSEDESCPLWKEFLAQTTGQDPKLQRFLHQWAGYCLTGDTREQKLFFGYGPGGNGKTVFANTLSTILGDYAKSAAMSSFEAQNYQGHPTDLAMLQRARMVTASETEANKFWAENRIKALTGGDPITARFMRRDFFTYNPTFKLTIIGNHRPTLRNVNDAIRRRLCIVPFTQKPNQPDLRLTEKLRDEHPAILRWMINGCLDWIENGLLMPAAVTAETDEYFVDQDLFDEWLRPRCDTTSGSAKATSQALLKSWNEFLGVCGEPAENSRRLADRLRERGFKNFRTSSQRGYEGIRIHPIKLG